MASLKIITNLVSKNHAHECIVSSDGIMRFYHYHNDGDLFAFATLIFAPEISTIFVPEICGFNFHPFGLEAEFDDIEGMEDNDHIISRGQLNDVLLGMFSGYTKVNYGPDKLDTAIDAYKTAVLAQAPILRNLLPSAVVTKLLRDQLPEWVTKEHVTSYLQYKFELDATDCRSAFRWFQDVPLVTVEIDVDVEED